MDQFIFKNKLFKPRVMRCDMHLRSNSAPGDVGPSQSTWGKCDVDSDLAAQHPATG